jgi:hypothetical protein
MRMSTDAEETFNTNSHAFLITLRTLEIEGKFLSLIKNTMKDICN